MHPYHPSVPPTAPPLGLFPAWIPAADDTPAPRPGDPLDNADPTALDPDQRAFVESDPGRPTAGVAAAGSGKTRALVHRIAHLVRTDLPPASAPVLAITFARSAAREMDGRLRGLLGPDSTRVQVRTMHSWGAYLLGAHGLGWSARYCDLGTTHVASPDLQGAAAALAADHSGVSEDPCYLLTAIAAWKTGRPDDAACVRLSSVIRDLVAVYDTHLHEGRGLVDFSDLVMLPLHVLEAHPAAQAEIAAAVQHVACDEAQDLSRPDAALLAWTAGPTNRLTVVGDARQAIYGFRGSHPDFLLGFTERYLDAVVHHLNRAYRLTEATVRVANAVASMIPGGETPAIGLRPGGERPCIHIADTEEAEAQWVASSLQTLHRDGIIDSWADAAILTRTRAQHSMYRGACRVGGIPVSPVGARPRTSPAVRRVLAWCHLVRDDWRDACTREATTGDDRTAQIMCLRALGAQSPGTARILRRSGLWTVGRLRCALPPDLPAVAQRDVTRFLRTLDALATLVDPTSALGLVDMVLATTGAREEQGTGASGLAELRRRVQEDGDLALALAVTDDADDEPSGVGLHLMTIHKAKGREFAVVCLAGVSPGLLPHHSAVSRAAWDAEACAFYVGITRARERLLISGTSQTGYAGSSSLISLIPRDLVTRMDDGLSSRDRPGDHALSRPPYLDGDDR